MVFNKLILNLLVEADFLKGRKTKPLVDAITNRNPITFYYTGPREKGKDSVLSGTRVRAEAVALGLSKKGNLIVRAHVEPPSVSKKGFNKTKWRTFLVNRMSNITVITDEQFNEKRPGYKEGEESKNGPMVVTYVTTNWTDTTPVKKEVPKPEEKPKEKPKTLPQPKPEEKPSAEPETLPQPKPEETPSQTPEYEPKDFSKEIFNNISSNIKTIDDKKYITTQEYQVAYNNLYKLKEKDWVEKQKQIGGNTNPGSGTRKRFNVSSNYELSNILSKNGVTVVDNLPVTKDENNLQESLRRIKTLMFG
jgi:hypothetical protein